MGDGSGLELAVLTFGEETRGDRMRRDGGEGGWWWCMVWMG